MAFTTGENHLTAFLRKIPRNHHFIVVLAILSDMLLAMMSNLGRTAFPIMAAFAGLSLATLAHARSNPYQVIVERNPFGLKPVPPPVTETNQTVATPPVKVVLTGVTSMFGPNSKRVFLEMTEQQPAGKPAATPIRAMLGEGDREGDIEVVSIDIDRSVVRIRNSGAESELTFEVAKPAPSTPAGQAAASAASAAPAAPASSQPIIISSSESRGGVTMAGGGGAFQGNTAGVTSFGGSTPMAPGNSGGVSSYGGISPTGFSPSGSPALAGSPSIPSRVLRTPQATESLDPAARDIRYAVMKEHYEQINARNAQNARPGQYPIQYPPMPPSRISQLDSGGPPTPPGFR